MAAPTSAATIRLVILEPGPRRARLIASYEIDLVIDVGANSGQYARSLRDARYDGRIVSFEPGSAAFSALSDSSADDAAWECHQMALGSTERLARLNLAEDDRASSLLTVMERHVTAAPESAFVAEELVAVRRLDSVWPEPQSVAPYLKIDVQGGELEVLRGAGTRLGRCVLVEVEISLVPLYEPGPLFDKVVGWLGARGFSPVAFECVLDDCRTGEMLQLDGIFAAQARLADRG